LVIELLKSYASSGAWRADGVALVSGALLPFAFAPFGAFPLAILSPAVLFLLWRGCPPRRAAWRGFLYGLGYFGVGGSWIYVSMHTHGGMPPPLAALIVVVFTSYLASYSALLGWLQARLFPLAEERRLLWVLPALWTLVEWLRGWLLSGFTWLQLAYSQIETPLSGFAPWLGAYGVSYVTALCAGLLALAWHKRKHRRMVALALASAAGLWVLGALAIQVPWTEPVDKPLRVALVQANIDLKDKWLSANRDAIADRYLRLTFTGEDIDLAIWPESAIPAYRDELEEDFLPMLKSLAAARDMGLVFGTVERQLTGDEKVYYNSAISIGEHGGVYRKHHLVPLGEFLPFPWVLRWLLDFMHIPMSDFSTGPARQAPLVAAGQKIAVSICYEGTFGEEIIRALPEATLLVNISEDAWFGDSLAPHQHLEIVRLRAVETGRSLLRATNTGISAIVDPRGRIVARTKQFQTAVLTGTVQPMRGATPYVRFGNYPVIVGLTLLLLAVGLTAILRTQRKNV
jgi:apolipoprotein N-acyltransferase